MKSFCWEKSYCQYICCGIEGTERITASLDSEWDRFQLKWSLSGDGKNAATVMGAAEDLRVSHSRMINSSAGIQQNHKLSDTNVFLIWRLSPRSGGWQFNLEENVKDSHTAAMLKVGVLDRSSRAPHNSYPFVSTSCITPSCSVWVGHSSTLTCSWVIDLDSQDYSVSPKTPFQQTGARNPPCWLDELVVMLKNSRGCREW